jgi:hypothetical protein
LMGKERDVYFTEYKNFLHLVIFLVCWRVSAGIN